MNFWQRLKADWQKYSKSFLELLVMIFVVILVRSTVVEPYVVPSGSMHPTLIEGDRVLVKKYSYGISRYSFPFSPPLFKGRIFEVEQPKRGDIVVFELDKVYIKRLIGEPGDKVQVIGGVLYINGKMIRQTLLAERFISDGHKTTQYAEQLTKDKTITILDVFVGAELDNTPVYTVPEDSYFMMGDNRDNSRDSRDMSFMGFVPKDRLLGRVDRIFFSSETVEYYNLPGIIKNFRMSRLWMNLG